MNIEAFFYKDILIDGILIEDVHFQVFGQQGSTSSDTLEYWGFPVSLDHTSSSEIAEILMSLDEATYTPVSESLFEELKKDAINALDEVDAEPAYEDYN